MRCITTASLTAALLLAPCMWGGMARAGSPPLSTDDPETPGAGAFELNLTSSIEKTIEGAEVEAPLFDLNYGLHDNDQLKVEMALLLNDPVGEDGDWGIGDLSVGYKYRFVEEGPGGLQISTYPQLSFPTGDHDRDLGSSHTELLIPLQFQVEFAEGRGWINPDVGYTVVFDHPKDDSIRYGLAAGWEAWEGFEVMGEVAGLAFPDGPEPNDLYFNVGFGYTLQEHMALLGSIGRSFYEHKHGTPNLTALFGVQLSFGGAAPLQGRQPIR